MSSPTSILPDDVFLAIFSHLTFKESICAQNVCHRWRILMPSVEGMPPIVLHIKQNEDEPVDASFPHVKISNSASVSDSWLFFEMTYEQAGTFLRRFCNGTHISLKSEYSSYIFTCLEKIKKNWRRIKYLEVEYLAHKNSFFFADIAAAGYGPMLDRVSSRSCLETASTGAITMNKFTKLSSIEVSPASSLNDYEIHKLPKTLNAIWFPESSLFSCPKVLKQMADTFGKSLRELAVSNVTEGQLLMVCKQFPNLRCLEISIPPNFDLRLLFPLRFLRQLNSLAVLTTGRWTKEEFFFDEENEEEIESAWQEQNDLELYLGAAAESVMGLDDENEFERSFESAFPEFDDKLFNTNIVIVEDDEEARMLTDLSFLFGGLQKLEKLILMCKFDPIPSVQSLVKHCQNINSLCLDSYTSKPFLVHLLHDLQKLTQLEVSLTPSNALSLTKFIAMSNSIRNMDIEYHPCKISLLVPVFKAFNLKARKNPNEKFKLKLFNYEDLCTQPSFTNLASNIDVFELF